MKESDIQTRIKHYVEAIIATPKELTGGFEPKVVRDGNFLMSQIEDQQKEALKNLEDRALYFKLSDMDIRKKPFDFFVLPAGYAWLVIYFEKSKLTYFCLYADIIKNKKKSFSEKEIEELSVRIVKL